MNFRNTRPKDWINPKKWASFLASLVLRYIYAPYIVEQYMLRFIECRDCLKAGACKNCGCTMPDKATVPWEVDSTDKKDPNDRPRWGQMLSKKDWEEAKEQYDVKFKIEYNEDF